MNTTIWYLENIESDKILFLHEQYLVVILKNKYIGNKEIQIYVWNIKL